MIHKGRDVTDTVRRIAISRGPQGVAWLRDLDALVADIERQWDLRVGRALAGATEAFVAEARTAGGEIAVLKVAIPGRIPMANQARTLMAAEGRGYARVFRYDEPRQALLLERLGPQLFELGLPTDDQIKIICRSLEQAWETPFEALNLPSGADRARMLAELIEDLWLALGKPCPERTIETATRYAELRANAFSPETSVLVHGDAHAWNTLQTLGRGSQFKLIDPDGVVAERACDLGISMREWRDELLAGDPLDLGRKRCALLSRFTAVPPEPIWQWGLLECISNGLLFLQEGDDREGCASLAVAAAWTADA